MNLMMNNSPKSDPETLFLVSNGDMPATISQHLYEHAWKHRIKPLDENAPKPIEMNYSEKASKNQRIGV